jgi:hypothetical protein
VYITHLFRVHARKPIKLRLDPRNNYSKLYQSINYLEKPIFRLFNKALYAITETIKYDNEIKYNYRQHVTTNVGEIVKRFLLSAIIQNGTK